MAKQRNKNKKNQPTGLQALLLGLGLINLGLTAYFLTKMARGKRWFRRKVKLPKSLSNTRRIVRKPEHSAIKTEMKEIDSTSPVLKPIPQTKKIFKKKVVVQLKKPHLQQ